MEAGIAFFGVIVGAAIAAAASIGGEYLRTRQEASLDSVKRRNDRWIEGTRDQRQLLIELQTQVTLYTKIVFEWAAGPEEMEGVRQSEAQTRLLVAQLRSRVFDDQLRDLVLDLISAAETVKRIETDGALEAFTQAHAAVNERAGYLIRETFRTEPIG